MADMDESERLIVQRTIAAQIDYPSVYMGGPSPRAMKIANSIINYLEKSLRIHASTCEHGSWQSYLKHGVYCPTCGMECGLAVHTAEIDQSHKIAI